MTGSAPDVRGLARAGRSSPVEIPPPARRWRTRVLVPGAIAAAALGLFAYAAWDTIRPAIAVRAAPVVVKSVSAADGGAVGAVTVQAPGWLEPDPHAQYVPALTSGVVDELLVLEGQRVEVGEVVARLIDDDAKLERARAAAVVDEMRAAVAIATAELDAARTILETLIDSTEAVERARADLAAAVAEHAQLDAEILAAEAAVRVTADELDRKSKLVSTQAVAVGEVERLRLRLEADRALLDAKRAKVGVVEARRNGASARLEAAAKHAELLIEERRAVARAEAQVAAAVAAERKAVAALGEADLRLERTQVRAPSAGVVLLREVSPGSVIKPQGDAHSAGILHLYDPASLQVRVDVPLADAARVGVDQRAKIVVDALPDRVFDGVVTRLVHLADIAKNTVEVKVAVTNPTDVLKPEMLARVRFLAAERPADTSSAASGRQRVFAPVRAVRTDGGRSLVLVVSELEAGRGRAEARDVTLGTLEFEDYIEIVDGLRPGDQVIVDAPADLGDGARVEIQHGGEPWR